MIALAVGLDASSQIFCESIVPGLKSNHVPDEGGFEKLLSAPPEITPTVILCGNSIKDMAPLEMAQSMRNLFPHARVLYVTHQREGFDKKDLIKNGFNDAFLLPLDNEFLREFLENQDTSASGKSFRPVKLIDIKAGTELKFDVRVFLPQNKKYVLFSGGGESFDQSRVDRLKKHRVGSLFVAKEQMPQFAAYTAECLAKLGKPDTEISETERTERLRSSVRDLFSEVVSLTRSGATIENGREIVADMELVVKTFILNSSPADWFLKLQNTMGSTGDTYSHAANVSTFAGLFSIGLQVGKPEEMAMAGLFHDLGLAEIPPQTLEKQESERTPEEQGLYQKHPEYSIDVMMARKLIVPQAVTTAILQHHERWDGKGYPKGIAGAKFTPEAQLLSLANQFDNLTRIEPGKKRMSPQEALQTIQKGGSLAPEFTKKAQSIFPLE